MTTEEEVEEIGIEEMSVVTRVVVFVADGEEAG